MRGFDDDRKQNIADSLAFFGGDVRKTEAEHLALARRWCSRRNEVDDEFRQIFAAILIAQ